MRTPPPITRFGVAGTHTTGKSSLVDSLAEALRDNLPSDVRVITTSFAGELRGLVNQVWPYDLGSEKRHPLERETLQATGEVWRSVDPLHWVRASLEEVDRTIEELDYLAGDELDDLRHVFVLYSDPYHLNEAVLMDRLLLVQNREVDIAPVDGYQPVSMAQTHWMLRNPVLMREVLTASGGSVRHMLVDGPEQVNTYPVVMRELAELVRLANVRREQLGAEPLPIPDSWQQPLFQPTLEGFVDEERRRLEALNRRAEYAS